MSFRTSLDGAVKELDSGINAASFDEDAEDEFKSESSSSVALLPVLFGGTRGAPLNPKAKRVPSMIPQSVWCGAVSFVFF